MNTIKTFYADALTREQAVIDLAYHLMMASQGRTDKLYRPIVAELQDEVAAMHPSSHNRDGFTALANVLLSEVPFTSDNVTLGLWERTLLAIAEWALYNVHYNGNKSQTNLQIPALHNIRQLRENAKRS